MDNAGTASVQDAERTFSLMTTSPIGSGPTAPIARTPGRSTTSTRRRRSWRRRSSASAWRSIQQRYPLAAGRILSRQPSWRHACVMRPRSAVRRATRASEALNGLTVIADWPELGASGPPFTNDGTSRPPAGAASSLSGCPPCRGRSPEDPAARPREQPRRPAPHVGRRALRRSGRTARGADLGGVADRRASRVEPGVVELTVAIHAVFNTPYDKLIWDVGHQCIRTRSSPAGGGASDPAAGRRAFRFTKRSESPYDPSGRRIPLPRSRRASASRWRATGRGDRRRGGYRRWRDSADGLRGDEQRRPRRRRCSSS